MSGSTLYDEEAERAALGAALLTSEAAVEVAAELRPDDLSRDRDAPSSERSPALRGREHRATRTRPSSTAHAVADAHGGAA